MYINGINGYLSKFEGTEVDAAVERVQGLDSELALKVDKTTTINEIPLKGDIVLTAEDLGALSASTPYGKYLEWENSILYLYDQNGVALSSKYIETDAALWGKITGTLSDQADLQIALDNKQNLITSENMLNADLVDDTNSVHKFATAGQLTQIAENTQNISLNTEAINEINEKIPVQASSSNQLADKEFVNSSIATNTAYFIGTFSSVTDLRAYAGTVTNNDYAFVINNVVTDNGNDWASLSDLEVYDKNLLTNFDYAWVINGSNFDLYRFDILQQEWVLRASNIAKEGITLNTAYNRYKASVDGSTITWMYEYTLNNSSFTASQWEAINSGATISSITQIETNRQAISSITSELGTFGNIVTHDVSEFATAAQGAKADTALQSINSSMVIGALGYTPEDVNNKVTSISSSSTDSQYPSAKLVYDQLSTKQATLESGVNIKTVNNESILGSGNIEIQMPTVDQTFDGTSENAQSGMAIVGELNNYVKAEVGDYRITNSVSGIQIGYADDWTQPIQSAAVEVDHTTVGFTSTDTTDPTNPKMFAASGTADGLMLRNITNNNSIILNVLNNNLTINGTEVQSQLVSGTNIKTVNNESILGSGNIEIQMPTVDQTFDGTSANAQSGVAIAGAGFIRSSNTITANRVLISDSNGEVASSSVSTTKLGYLSNVTSDIQIQLDSKISSAAIGTLTDVDLTNLADGEILKYDAMSRKWVNTTSSSGSSTIEDLTDVEITSPTQGQNLTYDAVNNKWINTTTTATIGWGGITGNIEDQTDLKNALDSKASVTIRDWGVI